MRDREGVPQAPFYTIVGEENIKDGEARSVQPLKIQHSQCSGPVAVCAFTSTAAASSPPPRLAGDHCSTPSPWRE